ncbi:MAG: hypothetical protein KAH01_04455 [Caldisericia bacterium]|nr:hypothetical protein [Caldisericia bacterium]
MSNNEEIKHVTPLSGHKLGFFKQKQCYLTFTDQRIIVAYHDPKRIKEEYNKKIEEHEKDGKKANIFKKIGANWSSHSNFHLRYLEMQPEEILIETEGNFDILPDTISKLVLKRGSSSMDEDGFERKSNGTLSVVTKDNKKLNFSIAHGQFNELSSALDHIIPEATFKRNKVVLKR